VNLFALVHPEIKAAAEKVRSGAAKLDMEELGLSTKLQDDTFLNHIQRNTQQWIKEIHKVTVLTKEPSRGTALQEINFWGSLEGALNKIQEQLHSEEIKITLAVLKQAKRFLVTVTFEADHGLAPAMELVSNCMSLMRDFPIKELLSATTVQQLSLAIEKNFTHLKKVKTADKYELSRSLRLVEALSEHLAEQTSSVLGGQQMMRLPYKDFEHGLKECPRMWDGWDQHLKNFQETVRELAKRRGVQGLKMQLRLKHTTLQLRLKELADFRQQHEKLAAVIGEVLVEPGREGGTSAAGESLQEVQGAYQSFLSFDTLDVTPEGCKMWQDARVAYDKCIDRVETQIASKLTDRLAATSKADEMFRVFSKFNALFFRPRIRSAIKQFQMKLIEQVKTDVGDLQQKFRKQYANSEAKKMSGVRDLPPISGMWMYVYVCGGWYACVWRVVCMCV
jgi:dynein heavy chain 1